MHRVEKYIDDVMTEKQPACLMTRLAVERHVNDLKDADSRGLYFDRASAQNRLDFYGLCHHWEGEWSGQVFEPSPFQAFCSAVIYGWKKMESGYRRFNEAYLTMARKQGKTYDAATDTLYLTGCDGEPAAQVFSIATKKDQAKIVHKCASAIVARSPVLKTIFKQSVNSIYVPSSMSSFRPLGRESKTEDGLNPHGVVADELHAHLDGSLYGVLESGTGARRQWLIKSITTRGFNIDCFCREYVELVISILDGGVVNDSIFGIIYELDKGDDWQDESVWIKANPNLGVSVSLDSMRKALEKALHMPSEEINFRTKRVNQWTEAKEIWFTSDEWRACGTAPIDERTLHGRPTCGGLDLSTTTDLTCWLLAVKADNGVVHWLPRFFIPGDNIKKLEDQCKVPIRDWVNKGFITATPGNVVDYDIVEQQMYKDREDFRLEEFGYDPWNSTQVNTHAEDHGLVPIEYRQGMATMAPICKTFDKHIRARDIDHHNNPVLAWNSRCTEIAIDNNDNYRPVKPKRKKQGKRIDGMVAAIMAQARMDAFIDDEEVAILWA